MYNSHTDDNILIFNVAIVEFDIVVDLAVVLDYVFEFEFVIVDLDWVAGLVYDDVVRDELDGLVLDAEREVVDMDHLVLFVVFLGWAVPLLQSVEYDIHHFFGQVEQ